MPVTRCKPHHGAWSEPSRVKDNLERSPSRGHTYASKLGRILFDDRYSWPKPKKKVPERKHKWVDVSHRHVLGSADLQLHGSYGVDEDGFHSRPSIKLPVPDHIKGILVDDWENVTKNNQLVPLPHAHSVDKIINDYLDEERRNREPFSAHLDILEETMAGLKEYFEKALSRVLLYRFERPQYHELRKTWEEPGADGHKGVCDTYGAEHLARLIVSLPELVAQTTMDQQSVGRLREELVKFTTWLGKNTKTYFVNEYETPTQQYVDHARTF